MIGRNPGDAIMQRCGVRLFGDLYERACDGGFRLPIDRKRRRRLQRIDQARTLFIHIPKNAGMSIAQALYGDQIKHATIRYYTVSAPRMMWNTTSFAVLRDPVARFVSAFGYAQAGGSADNRIAAPFRDQYRAFRTIDDAIDHVANAADIYQIDHVFRPQAWYIVDRTGKIAVDRLFLLEEFDRVRRFLALRDIAEIPHLNHVVAAPASLTTDQVGRIRDLYARDCEIVAALRAMRVTYPLPLRAPRGALDPAACHARPAYG